MKIILIIIFFYVTKVSAIVESQKIIPEFDPNHFHYMGQFSYGDGSSFGNDVAINSHTLVVTHSRTFQDLGNEDFDEHRTVNIFTKNNFGFWQISQKLTSPVTHPVSKFGINISISNHNQNTLLIADTHAPSDDQRYSVSTVYVFEKNHLGEWVEIQKIFPLMGESSWSQFNRQIPLAIYDDILVIGSRNEEYKGERLGAILIYKRNNQGVWEKHQVIYGPGGDSLFGDQIDIYNEKIIVSDPFDSTNGNRSGSVYFYEKIGDLWQQSQKIYADDAIEYQYFGSSISLSNDNIIVGDSGDQRYSPLILGNLPPVHGSVYVFSLDKESLSWYQSQKIISPESRLGDSFGSKVDLSGNAIVITAPSPLTPPDVTPQGRYDPGKAYLYLKDGNGTWRIEDILLPSDPYAKCVWVYNDNCNWKEGFGDSVAIYGGDIVVGMPKWKRQVSETDSNGEYQYVNFYGATYLYNSEQLMADIPIIGNILIFLLGILLVFLFVQTVKKY